MQPVREPGDGGGPPPAEEGVPRPASIVMEWMWGDAGTEVTRSLARINPLRWHSGELAAVAADLQGKRSGKEVKRPVDIKVKGEAQTHSFGSPAEAVAWLVQLAPAGSLRLEAPSLSDGPAIKFDRIRYVQSEEVKDGPMRSHTVYIFKVSTLDGTPAWSWPIAKRFSDFDRLKTYLEDRGEAMAKELLLPSKKAIGTSRKAIHERRDGLVLFVDTVLRFFATEPVVIDFLREDDGSPTFDGRPRTPIPASVLQRLRESEQEPEPEPEFRESFVAGAPDDDRSAGLNSVGSHETSGEERPALDSWEAQKAQVDADEPNTWTTPGQEFDDGYALVNHRVCVHGYGIGVVQEFHTTKWSSSSHTISFGDGGLQEVKLRRKNNGKLDFLVETAAYEARFKEWRDSKLSTWEEDKGNKVTQTLEKQLESAHTAAEFLAAIESAEQTGLMRTESKQAQLQDAKIKYESRAQLEERAAKELAVDMGQATNAEQMNAALKKAKHLVPDDALKQYQEQAWQREQAEREARDELRRALQLSPDQLHAAIQSARHAGLVSAANLQNAEEKLQSKQSADARARADLLERMQGKSSAEMQQLIDQRAKDLNDETLREVRHMQQKVVEEEKRNLAKQQAEERANRSLDLFFGAPGVECVACQERKLTDEFSSGFAACEHVHKTCKQCTIAHMKSEPPRNRTCPHCTKRVTEDEFDSLCEDLEIQFPKTKLDRAVGSTMAADEPCKAYITMLSGANYEIIFYPTMLVTEFQERVRELTGLVAKKQRLVYDGTRLVPMSAASGDAPAAPLNMAFYDVQPEATILLIVSMYDGGCSEVYFSLEWGFPTGDDFDFLDSSCLLFGADADGKLAGSHTIADFDRVSPFTGGGVKHSGDQFKGVGAQSQEEASEMSKRLRQAGAQTGDIQCSLMWNNTDDLDLHCKTPSGFHISYSNKKGGGGELDVDRNAGSDLTTTPVENIFFSNPEKGQYKFWVNNCECI
jgi:hypothetical protein